MSAVCLLAGAKLTSALETLHNLVNTQDRWRGTRQFSLLTTPARHSSENLRADQGWRCAFFCRARRDIMFNPSINAEKAMAA
jgi:hypothetical protein